MQIFIETLHNRIGERFSGKGYVLQWSAHKVYTYTKCQDFLLPTTGGS